MAPPAQLLRSGTNTGGLTPLKEYAGVKLVPTSQGSAQTGAGSADGDAVKDAVRVFVREADDDMLTGICAKTVLLRRAGIMPPTRNLEQPDPACPLRHIPNEALRGPVRHALTNAFGFGGSNGTLVISRWPGAAA
jgi:hypothetical protein